MAPEVTRLFLFGAVLICHFHSAHFVQLNDDGGYEIVIALEDGTPPPNIGETSYLDNIKTSLRAFSSRLWVTTKTQFYLKSVDILVPDDWNVPSALSATSQSFKNADIRLSPNITYPHVENPNVCGRPGNFIQLPSSFFNVTHSGPYGLHWKTLLHTWAMYRYGVHPEHGYIGDSKFPYATRDADLKRWNVTGCSDEHVQGKFINIEDPDDTTCESADNFSNSCRFQPASTGQNATTSLMHFHWIESVTDFCDETNHNILAQNQQNALCDYKSVWEVIRDSPDYVGVTSPKNESVPPVTFRTLKHSSTPLFYILVDHGLVQGSFSIATQIPRVVSSILSDDDLKNTVAAIGAFPGSENNPLTDLVQWSELGANRAAFVEALGTMKNNGPLERDFSRALIAVADKIKATNHPNGAVVLVLKYGADVAHFGGYLPEPEVFNAFNEANIILNTIELNFTSHTGYTHLAKVAQETGGSYVTVDSFGQAELNIRNVLNYVKRTLMTEYTDLRKTWTILRKETLTTSTTIPISTDTNGPLQIFVSTLNPSLSSANFSLTGSSYRSARSLQNLSFRLTRSQDWNEDGSKYTYKLEIPQVQQEGISLISLRMLCTASSDCVSGVLARAQFTGTSEVQIELSTSLESGVADLSSGQPVIIFAKVTKNDKPVQHATVIATLTETLSLRTTTLRLLDDGDMSPDAMEGDGFYSAYFAPETDGQFRLAVTIQGNPSTKRVQANTQRKLNESSFTRLLPIDQGNIGCGSASCDSETIDESFTQTLELKSTFSVINTSLFRPSPTKILSLMANDMPTSGQVTFYWQSPFIPGRFPTVSSYELKSATSLEQLIRHFDNQTTVPVPPNFRPKPPSSLEMISAERPSSTTYYAIRSVYRGKTSSISNIVSVPIESVTPTPTTPSTTPTSGTSDPTTNSTSQTPVPSSVPTTDTSEPTDETTTTADPSSEPTSTEPTTTTPNPGSSGSSAPKTLNIIQTLYLVIGIYISFIR